MCRREGAALDEAGQRDQKHDPTPPQTFTSHECENYRHSGARATSSCIDDPAQSQQKIILRPIA